MCLNDYAFVLFKLLKQKCRFHIGVAVVGILYLMISNASIFVCRSILNPYKKPLSIAKAVSCALSLIPSLT